MLTPWIAVLTAERPRPAWLRRWRHSGWLAVGAVCLGAFMGQLDASIVTLTYHPLRTQFHASLTEVQWVSLAYLLTLTALLLPVGRLADHRGRKLTYVHGFLVFTAGSAACGLAPSLGALVGFRVVQAVGAAMLQANSVALVTTSAPAGKLRAALGVQAAAQALGLALGPTVGGLLVSTVSWRWVFGVNVPIGLIASIAGIYLLPRTVHRAERTGRDLTGTLLLATATTSLLLGLSAVSGLTLPGWAAGALLAASVTAAGGFVLRERRATAPLIDLGLLRNRNVAVGLIGALCAYLVLFGPLVLVPVVFAEAGQPQLRAGLVLTALPAGFALGALLADHLLPAGWTARIRGSVGAILTAAALAALLATPPTSGWLACPLTLAGIGLGIYTPVNNALIMTAIPRGTAATGGGLVNTARGLGTALGVASVTLTLQLGAVFSATGRSMTGSTMPTTASTASVLMLLAVALVMTCCAAAPTASGERRIGGARPRPGG